ncbi:peptide/nickel transport system substrate-binding protein [Cohaesibacter sp. ES.047]|uniref:ABC transporter substrate-binding protein n=1 Tax=Cohaesibacter sp. ES.047 TaxID=1798205 RepID=UPI000BBF9B31|nr:ABC transporter substrate-binding protein [Cohaesibacter sp. ES.047]SNY92952.1 peptide/nickel transport system substrate-binding protein [Cohaesibacter sp. ES.047]
MKRDLLKVLLLGLAVLGISPIQGQAASEGQVLNIAHPVLQQNWSPLQGGGHGARWQSLSWAAPMYFDKDGKLTPYVLSSVDSDDSYTNWTLHVNPKAVFSDGSKITAQDVVGTWNLSARPATKHARVNLFLGGVKGFNDVAVGKAKDMEGLAIKDDATVSVTLASPDPIFDQKIATALIAPVKISQAEDENGMEKQDWWMPENGVVVSGPFMPESIDLDQGVVTLIPNPNFFGPAPKLEKIVLTTVSDASTATLMLKRGTMDAHTELITPTIIQDLGADFLGGPALAKGQQFWINSNKPPMDDINVRKALIMSVNPEELALAAFPDGPFTAATQILNKVPGVDPDFKKYPFDPEAAKAALAASKYKDASRLPKIMFVGISTPTHEAAAQYIAEQWRKILGIQGIEMKPAIETYSGPDQKSVQIFRDDVGTRVPDAVSYLMGSIYSKSGNARNKLGGYKNEEIDALLEDASVKGVKDPKRIELAQQAQRLFRDDWVYIPYYYDVMSKWAMPWVQNFDKNDDWQVIEPWNVTIDESKRP